MNVTSVESLRTRMESKLSLPFAVVALETEAPRHELSERLSALPHSPVGQLHWTSTDAGPVLILEGTDALGEILSVVGKTLSGLCDAQNTGLGIARCPLDGQGFDDLLTLSRDAAAQAFAKRSGHEVSSRSDTLRILYGESPGKIRTGKGRDYRAARGCAWV
ncbi:MAG: hypothetical protein AAF513_00940 [Pseudomonadota bacterium]